MHVKTTVLCGALGLLLVGPANAGLILNFDDGSGLSAEAEFTLLGAGDVLEIRLKNTSTSIPGFIDNSGQILTGLSWDFGHVGFNGDVNILSGTVFTGPTSSSVNFSIQNVGPNEDVTGEWGYGNMDGTGALTNFFTAHSPQSTPFGGANLDGPVNIDGPQAGLISSIASLPLGGLGAIQDEVIATLTLSGPIGSEQEIFGDLGLARVEFGSDAHFITVPAPGTFAPLALVGVIAFRRRR